MRPELEKFKYIEEYLTGNLPQDEVANFEDEITTSPELAKEVEFQRQLIKRSERLAFKEQLNAFHEAHFEKSGKKWWQKNIWLNSLLVLLVVGGVFYGISRSTEESVKTSSKEESKSQMGVIEPKKESEVLNQEKATQILNRINVPEDSNSLNIEQSIIPDNLVFNEDEIEDESSKERDVFLTSVSNFSDSLTPTESKTLSEGPEEISSLDLIKDTDTTSGVSHVKMEDFIPEYDTICYYPSKEMVHEYKRSGTKIKLPKKLVNRDTDFEGLEPVKLLYREYRNQAEIAFSGIPMIYNEKGKKYQFESAGMFEFIPLDESLKMNPKMRDSVEIEFVLTDPNIDMDYYEYREGKWIRKAKVKEEKEGKRKALRLKCNTARICNFEVKGTIKSESLKTEIARRKDLADRKISSASNPYSFAAYFLWKKYRQNRAKKRGLPDPYEKKRDVYGLMEFEVKIPNKSRRKKVQAKVHIDEVAVYKKNPISCYEARELLFKLLDKNCNTCNHKTHIAPPDKVAMLHAPLYNTDSLNNVVKKRNDTISQENKEQIIEAIMKDASQDSLSQINVKSNGTVSLRSVRFGRSNFDGIRLINGVAVKRIFTMFKNINKKSIKGIKKISVVSLNFNSALSYPSGRVLLPKPSMEVIFVMSEEGLFYINNEDVIRMYNKNIPSVVAKKLPESICSSASLMEFINKERDFFYD